MRYQTIFSFIILLYSCVRHYDDRTPVFLGTASLCDSTLVCVTIKDEYGEEKRFFINHGCVKEGDSIWVKYFPPLYFTRQGCYLMKTDK